MGIKWNKKRHRERVRERERTGMEERIIIRKSADKFIDDGWLSFLHFCPFSPSFFCVAFMKERARTHVLNDANEADDRRRSCASDEESKEWRMKSCERWRRRTRRTWPPLFGPFHTPPMMTNRSHWALENNKTDSFVSSFFLLFLSERKRSVFKSNSSSSSSSSQSINGYLFRTIQLEWKKSTSTKVLPVILDFGNKNFK